VAGRFDLDQRTALSANVRDWLTHWISVPELLDTFDQTDTPDFEAEMQVQVLARLAIAELAPGNVQNVSLHLGLGGYQCAWTSLKICPECGA